MPRVKSVTSLAQICIHFVLENQQLFCEKFPLGELEEVVDALDSDKPAKNPFDELPTDLLQELVRLLREHKSSIDELWLELKIAPLFKLLITPRLQTLDLTRISNCSDISNILHLAAIRSPHLKNLRIKSSNPNEEAHTQYVKSFNFITKFSKLQILDISYLKVTDDCFNLIGIHCPDLRELHVKHGEVTDDGIRKLCLTGSCKSIRLLNLETCINITTKGIQMALDHLPQLRVLRHASLLECLAAIAETAIDQKLNLPQYALSSVYMLDYTIYKSNNLRHSVQLCPNVTEVYLSMFMGEELTNDDLLGLLSLDKLYTLELSFRIGKDFTFDSGVVPLLTKFGFCLKRIKLEGCFVVDIHALIKFCPNLESLNITRCKIDQLTKIDVKKVRGFPNLKKLFLDNYDKTISSENLFALLSSPSLSNLTMRVMTTDALTDNVLQKAHNLHSFRNLECLHLFTSHCITKKGVDIFLQETNPLTEIRLTFHRGSRITSEDIMEWNDNPIWIIKNWQFHFVLIGYPSRLPINLGGHIWHGAV